MRASVLPVFEYRLDSHDLILWVSEDWLAFARENGASELNSANVVGRSLWSFIPDEPTRRLYRDVFGTVRSTDQPVVLPFRCDSATLRRFMRLEVRHIPGCGIDLKSVLVRAEPCDRRALLDANAVQTTNCVTMCSCCKHVYIEPQGWLSLEEASNHPRLCPANKRPQIRYEVCAACQLLATRERIAAIQARLEATRSTVTTENVLEWVELAKEQAALTRLTEGARKQPLGSVP